MTTNTRISKSTYICELCDYISIKRSDYIKHCNTIKHRMRNTTSTARDTTHIQHENSQTIYTCECGKSYNHRASLWNHKKKCVNDEQIKDPPSTTVSTTLDSVVLIKLLQQNNEFKQLMIEQSKQIQEQNKQIIDLAKNSNNTTNNTTTNNTTNNNRFNLNVFLNETCKDAINLNDFIQSIELNINDFINTGEVGYVKGISNIMVERIRDMEPHFRPIHCTDFKREIVYVKDSDKWEKEDDNKTHLRKAVRIVADKNKVLVHPWREENPNYEILDTPECNKFFEYTKASLGGYGKEEDLKFENKIINNILKETVIDKNLLEN